jgi:hypothetical protein
MQESFFNRYIRGEYESVSAELLSLGPKVRDGPIFADAQAVAQETMRRVRKNIEILIPRLKQIGYQFGTLGGCEGDGWAGNQFPIHQPPAVDVIAQLDELEAQVGQLPIALRAWWELVGGVNFLGFHPDWPETQVLDPIFLYPLDLDDIRSEHEALTDQQVGEEEARQSFAIPIPDEYHKADVSGGVYEIVVSPDMDSPFLGEWHATTFVSYLRVAFRWAGFPGFGRCGEDERPSKQLKCLTDGLQPF